VADRVSVVTADGQYGTVDAGDAASVADSGGKVLTAAEAKAHETQLIYDKQSAAAKVANTVLAGSPVIGPYLASKGGRMAPELEAFKQGISETFTGGLTSIATKEIVGQIAGKEAAHEYGQYALDSSEAHAGAHTAGQVVGFGGSLMAGGPKAGLGKAASAIPGVGVGVVGGIAEQGAARVLAPLAAKGAIGRALATGGSMAARGAVEGSLYGAASQITEDMLGDKDIVADKVFASMGTGALYGGAGGFVLGGAGSLAASGARATVDAVSGLGKALTRTEGAAAGKAAGLADDAAIAAEKAATKAEPEAGALRKMLQGEGDSVARDAASTMAFDALGTTRKVSDKIGKEVAGGTKAVGDYVNRRILRVASDDASFLGSLTGGRADELLPLIQADRATIGASIGDVVKAAPVRVAVDDLLTSAAKTTKEMLADPTRIQGAEAFRKQVGQTFEAFTNGGKIVDGSMDLAEMYYARASMEGIAREMKTGNRAAGEAMKGWLREVDSVLVDKIDDAAKALGDKGAKEKLLGLKREYQLASAAEKAAQDGADRLAGNNTFGLREGIGAAVGMATGNPLAAIGMAVGGKVLRERGSAAGAYLATKVADMGAISRAIRAVDEQVGRSAKGILGAPKRGPLPEAASREPLRARAARILDDVAKVQADPEAHAARVAQHTEALNGNAPNLAGGLTARLTSAAAFLAGVIPVHGDVDPFDPHPAARLSDAQAATVVRYGAYVERPMLFFEELEHGKMTHEGIEVAKVLMPGAFAELQQRTVEGLAELMAQGKKPPFAQRERLGILLDFPATPSQRPEHMRLLQANVTVSGQAAKTASPGAQAPKRPLPTKSQPSTLDRLEGR
jgi:hypothetical protein